jgi:glycosyltransferase involved in cell wall biosynthesis
VIAWHELVQRIVSVGYDFSLSNSFSVVASVELPIAVDAIVAMAVYSEDRIDLLEQAVNSILSQDYRHFLFVVVIDGPINKQMHSYLTQTADDDKRVILVQSGANVGLRLCMNYVVDFALHNSPSVNYFIRMDADDISLPERISKQVSYLEKQPKILVPGSSLVEVNEKGIDCVAYDACKNNQTSL